jgi:tryptophan halogenase
MNLVVVGGGTAGWLTALYAKRVFPQYSVTLIESEDIGVLGAGEGATPILEGLLSFLEIDTPQLIKNTGATIKNGIKFTNWSEKEKSFYHPFTSLVEGSNDVPFVKNEFMEDYYSFSHMYAAKNNHSWEDYCFIPKLSEDKKVPFLFLENGFASASGFSFHFNAKKLAEFLREVGENRGISRVEGIVSDFESDAYNNINKVFVQEKEILCDFVFDCTGFARILIGKHFKSKWVSHAETLPAKKAIPFFLPMGKEIPPYTESTALDYGWAWKIPVQDRYGCGYVFDSDYISEDQAKKELDEFIGFEVDSPKTFSFEAGFYNEIWVNNCLAVGLSAGFIEPLEATSIMQFIKVLNRFFSNPTYLKTNNIVIKNEFNKVFANETQEVVDFIYLHYITDKKSMFWKEFTTKNKLPDRVAYLLEVIKTRGLNSSDFFGKSMFNSINYDYVLIGNGLLTKPMLKNHLNNVAVSREKMYFDTIKKQQSLIDQFPSHSDAISMFKLAG